LYSCHLGLRFEAVVAKHATRPALRFGPDRSVTYEELNREANRLARYFIGLGLGKGAVVALQGRKVARTFACMLACLKIGVAYSIFDPDSPLPRLERIFAKSQPRLVVADASWTERLSEWSRRDGFRIVPLEDARLDGELARLSGDDLGAERPVVTGANPAYLMFTSGSTGFPKGAVMTHENVLNLIGWAQETYGITCEDTLTNVNPVYFDNSVFDFYSALFSGAALAPFDKDVVTNPKRLLELIDALGCTIWFSVPSLLIYLMTMRALARDTFRSIRAIIFGGEGYPKPKLRELHALYSDRAKLHNVYGPTECTCICSSYEITDADFADLQGFPPLGSLAKNFSGLIVDDDGRPVERGAVGELCLLGPNVGKGYYNDPGLTAERFVQNPLNASYPEVMYKTGDLVRLSPEDGKLGILGRKDNQIKHMGFRIELEEIETALSRLDYVKESVVFKGEANEVSQIIAVVAAAEPIDKRRLRQDLGALLPPYMIPTKIVVEKTLPKNANGKIDRKGIAERYRST
jgi:D-alanine--poly(phosphoribitol) ligase subunit 1